MPGSNTKVGVFPETQPQGVHRGYTRIALTMHTGQE